MKIYLIGIKGNRHFCGNTETVMLSDMNTRRVKMAERVIWRSKRDDWKVIRDQYGIGITDDYWIDRPLMSGGDNPRLVYEWSELIPQHVKKRVSALVASGAITIKRA